MNNQIKQPSIVLIVEDDADIADVMADILLREQHEVYQLRSHIQLNRWFETHTGRPPDLILLDLSLPGMTGQEIYHELRADPITTNIPVIVVTANDQLAMRVKMLNEGVDDYLTKPFEFKELISRVNIHIRISHLRREKVQAETLLNDHAAKLRAVHNVGLRLYHQPDFLKAAPLIVRTVTDKLGFESGVVYAYRPQYQDFKVMSASNREDWKPLTPHIKTQLKSTGVVTLNNQHYFAVGSRRGYLQAVIGTRGELNGNLAGMLLLLSLQLNHVVDQATEMAAQLHKPASATPQPAEKSTSSSEEDSGAPDNQRAMAQMFAAELSGPLQSLSSWVQVAKNSDQAVTQQQYLNRAAVESERLIAMVKEMLKAKS